MGVGAAWAGGCSIGNALVQTSLLSWQGWIALVFQILGVGGAAWATLIRPREQRRRARAAQATAETAEYEPAAPSVSEGAAPEMAVQHAPTPSPAR